MRETRGAGFAGRWRSFGFAIRGLGVILNTQPNARIHAFCTVAVCLFGALLRISAWEWCAISFAIAGVWITECLNTALEFLADHASPGYSALIRDAKDVAAAGVLIASCAAVVIGIIVFAARILS